MIRPFFLGLLLLTGLAAQPVAPQRTELTADYLESTSTATETRAICTGNVRLTGTNLTVVCDRLEIISARDFDPTSTIGELKGFKYLLATGNVRVVQGTREATCGRAEVLPAQDKVILTENPVVLDRAADIVFRGEQITFLRGEQRLEVKQPHASGPTLPDLGPDAQNPEQATTPTPAL